MLFLCDYSANKNLPVNIYSTTDLGRSWWVVWRTQNNNNINIYWVKVICFKDGAIWGPHFCFSYLIRSYLLLLHICHWVISMILFLNLEFENSFLSYKEKCVRVRSTDKTFLKMRYWLWTSLKRLPNYLISPYCSGHWEMHLDCWASVYPKLTWLFPKMFKLDLS